MQRVMIVGGSGSGKSTLARWLGAQTGLPVYHMDHIQWQAGWQSRTRAARQEMALAVERREAWIFEGGFSTTYAHRAGRADTLIWLDLPVGLRMWRVTKRLWRYYGQRRPDMAEGCFETIHSETLPFYRWIWQTRQSHRIALENLIAQAGAACLLCTCKAPRRLPRFRRGLLCCPRNVPLCGTGASGFAPCHCRAPARYRSGHSLSCQGTAMTRILLLSLMTAGLLSACTRVMDQVGEPPIQPAMDPEYTQSIGFTGINAEPF